MGVWRGWARMGRAREKRRMNIVVVVGIEFVVW
jgi:hypothetical protein